MQCNVSTHAIQGPFTHSGVSETDLFAINREVYFLVSDYYSKLPHVSVIPNPVTNTASFVGRSHTLLNKGVPQRVISDNGCHFSSDALRRLSYQWCFDHKYNIQPALPSVEWVHRTTRSKRETYAGESRASIRLSYCPSCAEGNSTR